LPAAAAAIDRYLLPAEPTAANLQQRPDSRNRQTERGTPGSCIDPYSHTMEAMQITGKRQTPVLQIKLRNHNVLDHKSEENSVKLQNTLI